MRKLLPGLSDKTDKATVFEFAARYIHFLKGFVGSQHDKVKDTKPNQQDNSARDYCLLLNLSTRCVIQDMQHLQSWRLVCAS